MTAKGGGLLLLLLVALEAAGQPLSRWEGGAALRFTGKEGQIEVGGPAAGMEFHDSRPLPSRISFYYPVANSIDLSTDYWRRGESRPLVVGICVDRQQKRWLGKEPWDYVVSPHRVRFERAEEDLRFALQYEFGARAPAAVITVHVMNKGRTPHDVELCTHLSLTLRSCQTYARFAGARSAYDRDHKAVVARFNDPPVGRAAVIVQNAGIIPSSWTTSAQELGIADSGWSNWIEREGPLKGTTSAQQGTVRPVAGFVYRFTLPPGDSVQIIQLLSSVRQNEVAPVISRAARAWREDVAKYETLVRSAVYGDAGFHSGDAWTDSSASFARALLAANQHYLDGAVVPMPCPAEYNFFFTHDVLLTDLSAIMFDPERVRRDLLYLARHSRDTILPHAYYWKDDGFKTEYCAPGNWNNLWFIMAAAAYLRHTMDTATVLRLYPILAKGLERTLSRRVGNVLHGSEPDWWDFGHAEGGRAYLTVLTIRAIEEYVFVSAWLRKNLPRLGSYESIAAELRSGLLEELWDEPAGYLLNTTGAVRDRHIYMGPLLAAVYDLLPAPRAQRLVATATSQLLDQPIGLRTVSPADFHTDSVKNFYQVKANEAGDAFLYANGGVWYLSNTWYAWALRSVGEIEGSFDFFRRTMTLDGILQSPHGQPALYEYRYADPEAQDHGRVDKPAMMWSAGFCIGTAYRMAGFQDNVWNVTCAGEAPSALRNVRCAYIFRGPKTLERTGNGSMLTRMMADQREIPSRVLPLDAASASAIRVEMGPIRYPFLDSVNAVLHTASLDPQARVMKLTISSFEGHLTSVRLISPWLARSVSANGKALKDWAVTATPRGTLIVTVRYRASTRPDTLEVTF